jgi:hypothetical protein
MASLVFDMQPTCTAVTRYHRKWDRRGRLLNACRRLFAEILNSTDRVDRPRSDEAERLYVRSKSMLNLIKRELDRG